jgi:hypothetical protein
MPRTKRLTDCTTFDEGIGIQPSRITVKVGIPSSNSTNQQMEEPVERLIEDGIIPEEEDALEQVHPQCISTPPVILPVEPEPCRSTRTRWAPVPDDDERYDITSYGKKAQPHDERDDDNPPPHANRAELTDEPPTYKAAMASPEAAQWLIACIEELKALERMQTYELVDRPKDRKVVDSKWVFKVKRGPDGKIAKYKGQVVAKGFTQIEGPDYN